MYLIVLVTDNCLSMPCLNGATCSNSLNNYTCSCAVEYTGFHCQTGNHSNSFV